MHYYIRCWKCGTKRLNDSPKVMVDEFKRYVCESCYLEDPLQLKRRRGTFDPIRPNIVQAPTNVYERTVGLTWNTIPFTWDEITTLWNEL